MRSVGPVLATSVLAVCKVALVAFGGLYLSRRGVLDVPARRKLSQVTLHLTLPAFLFSQVAQSVTAEAAARL